MEGKLVTPYWPRPSVRVGHDTVIDVSGLFLDKPFWGWIISMASLTNIRRRRKPAKKMMIHFKGNIFWIEGSFTLYLTKIESSIASIPVVLFF